LPQIGKPYPHPHRPSDANSHLWRQRGGGRRGCRETRSGRWAGATGAQTCILFVSLITASASRCAMSPASAFVLKWRIALDVGGSLLALRAV
jgi:hypothetical protein